VGCFGGGGGGGWVGLAKDVNIGLPLVGQGHGRDGVVVVSTVDNSKETYVH